jgi:alpha-galactosidase
MELVPIRAEAAVDGRRHDAPVTSWPATATLGPLQLDLQPGSPSGLAWRLANRSDATVAVRSVSLVFAVAAADGPVRMFRHGYQSWSPTGVATFGRDEDPSRRADLEFLQAVHHADQRQAVPGELRSEWVTLLADAGGGAPVLIGFDAGTEHDGTLRLRPGAAGPELWAEAFMGGAHLVAGEARPLHTVLLDTSAGDAGHKLDGWATTAGRRGAARSDAPFQVGWCSWYHYFHDISEAALDANLARSDDWPFEVFQLDDGYQAAIGDWLTTNEKFPSSLDAVAGRIADAGRRPGIWLAPFLAAPDAEVTTRHPGWMARHVVDGRASAPLHTWWNPSWGGGRDGLMYGLDTSSPEVAAHLEGVARDLVDAGFSYLKLDFTFSPSVDGGYHDPSLTPAQRVRAGFEAIRRGAGDDAFILGCGVPLANVVGVVDANRIGQDVAPLWSLRPEDEIVPGYLDVQPSTQLALANTVARAFMHRRLWANDPDCVMLRTDQTDLSEEAARTWAHAVGMSGGLVLVSDDLALLDAPARALLDDVIAIGRAVDAEARAGRAPRAPDLLDRAQPSTLEAAGHHLVVDLGDASSTLVRPTGGTHHD